MSAGEGILEQTGAGPRLRYERLLGHPPDAVWRALTDPEELRAWFPQRVVVERWQAGAQLRFTDAKVPEANFDGEVLECDPPRALEYRWGPDVLRFELEPVAGGTLLRFLDTLELLGKAARDAAGWQVCLEALESSLEGAAPPFRHAERWREVHPGYVERFGADAASLGPPEGALD